MTGAGPVRRRVLLSLAGALPAPAGAQDFPSRPLRMVVAYASDGGTDLMARAVAAGLR